MRHVLFVSYDGLTDPLGPSQILPYLTGLTRYNFRFTILSFEKPGIYEKNRALIDQLIKGLPINWVSTSYHKNPPVLSSIYDYRIMKHKIREIFNQDPFLMIHTRPGLPELAALSLKKELGVFFFHDVRGFWADERVDGGMWNQKNPLFRMIYRFFKKKEKEALLAADAINCITYAARKEMNSRAYLKHRSITVVPCAADLSLFDPSLYKDDQKMKIRQSLGFSENDMIFCYLGSIGGWYMTPEMMSLCKKISLKIPAAAFLFISPHRHDVILEAASKASIPLNRIKTVKAVRNEVPGFLSIANYSIFFIKPCFSKISSSPTKHGEIMSMGIPVITNSGVGDVAEIVSSSNSGILIDEFDELHLEKAVDEVITRKFDPEKIRKAAFEYYSLEKALDTYRMAYEKLLS